MSEKVKNYLLIDSVGIAINVFITMILCYFCSFINYNIIEIIIKSVIIGISVIINLFVIFFFLLYWWSDIKWTECKQKAKRLKKHFANKN